MLLIGRPIVACVDSPTSTLASLLTSVLQPLVVNCVPAHLTSTSHFLENIRDYHLEENHRFVSFDVVNLYGSIPLEDSCFPGLISIVTEFFFANNGNPMFEAISRPDFAELLRMVFTSDTVKIKDSHFHQTSGIQMGNGASVVCAVIFMDFIEKNILQVAGDKIKLWVRFIDDIFCIFERADANDILNICNDIHPSISFTVEHAVDNSLAFLDVFLQRNSNNGFSFSLYSKPSHSGHVLPWKSHHVRSLLINVLINEFRRALALGSDHLHKEKGIEMIRQRFASNGYPPNVLKRCEWKARLPATRSVSAAGEKRVFLSLPFQSEQQARAIRSSARKCGLTQHMSLNFYSKTLAGILKPKKEKLCTKTNCKFCEAGQGDCWTKECVYLIKCLTCDSFYIGETKRTMRSRLREHMSSESSLVHEHLKSHSRSPKLDDIRWNVLHARLDNWSLRRRVELSEIQKRNPDINVQR